MASKAFLITMAFLALSLIISSEVTARYLAEFTTAEEAVNEPEKSWDNEADVGEAEYPGFKYPGGGFKFPGGGFKFPRVGYGGLPRFGFGGFPGGGYGGGYPGVGIGGGYP